MSTTRANLARSSISSALVPLKCSDGYSFGRFTCTAAQAAAINAVSEPLGASLVRLRGRSWAFVTPKLIADAVDDYAGQLLTELANAGLIVARYVVA